MTSEGSSRPSARLSIAVVHIHAWPNVRRGGERLAHDLAGYLRGAGHSVDLISGSTLDEARSLPGSVYVTHRRARPDSLWTDEHRFGWAVAKYLRRNAYDVVHALSPSATLAGTASRLKTVYTELGAPTQQWLSRQKLALPIWRRAVRSASAVTALSAFAGGRVHALSGRLPWVIPPGVRTDSFRPDLSMRRNGLRILFSADLSSPAKGLELLLDAMPLILADSPDAKLLLSGPGDPSSALRRAGGEVRDAIQVLGLGKAEDVADTYRSSTLTVLPSRGEAFGLALVESLACGTPIVAMRGQGPDDIISAPTVGETFEPDNANDLARAIARVAALARQQECVDACHQHALRWDWATVGPRYESLYQLVSAGARGFEPMRADG